MKYSSQWQPIHLSQTEWNHRFNNNKLQQKQQIFFLFEFISVLWFFFLLLVFDIVFVFVVQSNLTWLWQIFVFVFVFLFSWTTELRRLILFKRKKQHGKTLTLTKIQNEDKKNMIQRFNYITKSYTGATRFASFE